MELEQYGVWVKAGPEDVADDNEEMFALSDVGDDVDQDTFAESSDLTSEEEDLLASLEEKEPATEQPAAAAQSADGDEDFSFDLDQDNESLDDSLSLDDFTLDDIELDDMSIPAEESAVAADLEDDLSLEDSAEELPELDMESDEGFDDLDAVTREMTDNSSAPSAPEDTQRPAAEPIGGIESELASIKAELQALREELAEIRSGTGPAPSGATGSAVDSSEEPQLSAGFFEEDEDETIALTDDELDNILNTAEFTEELGKPSEVDDVDEAETAAEPLEQADQISLEQLDDVEMIDLSDESGEEASQREDQSLHGGDILAPSSFDEEITLEDEDNAGLQDSETAGELFVGTQEDVDALADMDIDSELAGIEELRDDEDDHQEAAQETGAAELDSLEIDVLEAAPDEEESEESAEDLSLDSLDTLELDTLEASGEEFELEESADDENQSGGLELDLDDIGDDSPFDLSDEDELTPTFQADDNEDLELDVDLDEGPQQPAAAAASTTESFPSDLREEIRSVLQYMDQLLESLPEEKIEEFARSEHFEVYKRLFEELGLDAPGAE
ncbi:MAG: hypothetical protein EA404_12830 [Spirochaetaceae bacterium]|nr:MAG: hypothetical protein EA404_12830 [Spirochaetaceae bacterium]